MCVSPNFVWVERGPTWEKQPVPCRGCWRCLKRRVNDYVGRCMAEAAYSDWTCTLTLTYAPWEKRGAPGEEYDLADKVVTPSHFQKFIRALRKRGHKVRYFVAGEYGEERGRAHFHCILFGIGPRPKWEIKDRAIKLAYPGERDRAERASCWPQEVNFHMTEWPHGHVFADWSVDVRSIRYAAKYLNKREPGKSWFSLSKKPCLGAAHFQALAARAVAFGALPASFEYIPPGVQEDRRYLMTGATRRDYLLAVMEGWQRSRPLEMERLNEWVRKALEKIMFDLSVKVLEGAAMDLMAEDPEAAMQSYLDDLNERLERTRGNEAKIKSYIRWENFLQEQQYKCMWTEGENLYRLEWNDKITLVSGKEPYSGTQEQRARGSALGHKDPETGKHICHRCGASHLGATLGTGCA